MGKFLRSTTPSLSVTYIAYRVGENPSMYLQLPLCVNSSAFLLDSYQQHATNTLCPHGRSNQLSTRSNECLLDSVVCPSYSLAAASSILNNVRDSRARPAQVGCKRSPGSSASSPSSFKGGLRRRTSWPTHLIRNRTGTQRLAPMYWVALSQKKGYYLSPKYDRYHVSGKIGTYLPW